MLSTNVIGENESVSRSAYDNGEYVLCFLLIHALIESLLRIFLNKTAKESFHELIDDYSKHLQSQGQKVPLFVNELKEFNRRRNRVVHNLWKFGYSKTNETLEPACRGAFIVYGLLIEWLETFNPDIIDFGFEYEA